MKIIYFKIILSIIVLFSVGILNAQEVRYSFEPQYKIDHITSFSEGLAKAEKGYEEVGFIDKTGEFIIEPKFEEAGIFHDGLAWVAKTDSINGDQSYGYIDKQGELVIDYLFDEAGDFSCGRAAVKIKDAWKYIDKNGKVIFESTLDVGREFQEGLLLQKRNEKRGYVGIDGKTKIPFKFDNAHHFSEGLAVVTVAKSAEKNSKGQDTLSKIYQNLPGESAKTYIYQVIDTNGKIAFQLPPNIERLENFHDGMAAFRAAGKERFSRGKWGFISSKGEVVFKAQFNRKPNIFSGGIGFVQVDGERDDNKDGHIYTLDKQGTILAKIPLSDQNGHTMYNSKLVFREGLLAVKISEGPNTTIGKWGYRNESGKMIIKPQFSTALNFFEGTAIVVKDGNVGIIENPL